MALRVTECQDVLEQLEPMEPNEQRVDLGARKTAVLRAVVEEYVHTGEPVGSETVAERAGLGVSPATIRTEMAALEELGYLSHPHTSAGRAPTDLGYRRYVDSLSPGRLREAQRRAIAGFFEQTATDMEEVLLGAARLLSTVTTHAGLAVAPSSSADHIARVEILELGSALMLLVVGQHGRVYKAIVDRPPSLPPRTIHGVGGRLDARRRISVEGQLHGTPAGRKIERLLLSPK